MAEQISELSPRSGHEQGVMMLRALPHELRERYGWQFEVGEDDLGSMLFAFLRLASGHEVRLIRHRDAPVTGTSVWADAGVPPRQLALDLLKDLGLGPDDVEWVTPYVLTDESIPKYS